LTRSSRLADGTRVPFVSISMNSSLGTSANTFASARCCSSGSPPVTTTWPDGASASCWAARASASSCTSLS
jgi:hypothetical protein